MIRPTQALDVIRSLMAGFGHRAEQSIARYALGLSPSMVRDAIAQVRADLDLLSAGGLEEAGFDALGGLEGVRRVAPATWAKCLGRIAGEMLISFPVRARMSEADRGRAFAGRVLYECLQGLLDDLIDAGGYTPAEALRLYRGCLRPLTDTGADVDALATDLVELFPPDHEEVAKVLVHLVRALQRLLSRAPRALSGWLRGASEALSTGQAATVLQQASTYDLASLARIASALPSPDPSPTWIERLARNISWTSGLAAIDLIVAGQGIPGRLAEGHLAAWQHLDAVVTLVDHAGNAAADRAGGIVNVADLLAETAGSRDAVFRKAAEFAARAAIAARVAGGDPAPYVFLAAMVAVVACPRDAGLDAFLAALEARLCRDGLVAPGGRSRRAGRALGHHSATYSQYGSPRCTQRVRVTLPSNPLHRRTPS